MCFHGNQNHEVWKEDHLNFQLSQQGTKMEIELQKLKLQQIIYIPIYLSLSELLTAILFFPGRKK